MSGLELGRREFIKAGATAAGGFVVAFYVPEALGFGRAAFAADAASAASAKAQPAFAEKYPPNAFIRIAPDNSVTITINKFEMGQGVFTSLAQLICEELDCDWNRVSCTAAPVNPVYNHTAMPMQLTGGSNALSSSWEQHRKIGAMMRSVLVQAAATKWGIPASECHTDSGWVHSPKGKVSYGELAEAAAALPFPKETTLKGAKNFKIIGKSVRRIDGPEKSNGKAVFGIDVRIPGMLYAVIAKSPVHGGTIKSFKDAGARAIAGVVDVVRFGDSNRVAVLGKNSWAAWKGRDALEIDWDFHGKDNYSDESLMADFRKELASPGIVVETRGDADAAVKSAARVIAAEYEFPYLAHAPMETINCTIRYDGESCEIWSGHQAPTWDRNAAAKVLGLPPEKVQLHVTFGGGSFGRRANKVCEYVVEACELAKAVKKPLKIFRPREDDMAAAYFRPMNFHRVELAFDAKKKFTGWHHRVIGQTVVGDSVLEAMLVKDGKESTVTEGVSGTPYDLANFHCDLIRPHTDITTQWWRSVGHTHTAYVMETMIDELARETGTDALGLRERLLHKSPRHLAVLKLLKAHTPWGKPAKKGHAYGLAVHESFNSVVGQVAEVSYEGGNPRVHRVWAAVHCGTVVNPEGAKSQVESAIVYGLSAILRGEVKIDKGRIVTSNFHDYPVLRMNEMPAVEVFFVDSHEAPTGLGEPGTPPIGPAVANALFRLTGKRIRKLPFTRGLTA